VNFALFAFFALAGFRFFIFLDFSRRLVYYKIMDNNTKQKLIKAGAKAMLAKSYHAVGIQEILAAVDVPKGSFYHYFESKEAFGVAIIEYYGEQLASAIRAKVSDSAYSPRQRIVEYFLAIRDYYAVNGCGRGCLVAKLATEVANSSPAMREALKREFDKWIELFAGCIREGQKNSEIASAQPAQVIAEFLYTAWEGALIRMQVDNELTPVNHFIAYAIDSIIPKRDGAISPENY
jgi:TetR/AcrR family transcriptional repressor of nem operon